MRLFIRGDWPLFSHRDPVLQGLAATRSVDELHIQILEHRVDTSFNELLLVTLSFVLIAGIIGFTFEYAQLDRVPVRLHPELSKAWPDSSPPVAPGA